VLDAQAALLRAERARVLAALRALPGLTAFDSAANFILIKVADPDGVFARLKARGILIKNPSRMHPLLAGCLRITVGAPQENDALLAALTESLRS
jgi:histidinol-phosphate aminotransferase